MLERLPKIQSSRIGTTITVRKLWRGRTWWSALSLARQFALAASIIVLLAMTAVGSWVAKKIEHGVSQNTAAASALYVDALIAPLAQELATGDRISPGNVAKLEVLLSDKKIRASVAAVKIWKKGRTIAYSTWSDQIGKTFTATPALRSAWKGIVTAEFDHPMHEDDANERALGVRLLEVYAPIREPSSGRIIAVSEFYIRADSIKAQLNKAGRQSWLVVGGTAILIMLLLSGLVRQAGGTISRQKSSLQDQVAQLERLLAENNDLRSRVQRAYARTGELNERFLRRVGSDLHDGPAQLLGLALLQLDSLKPEPPGKGKHNAASDKEFDVVRGALKDALKEVRTLSSGLVLPELDDLPLDDVIKMVVNTHESRTNTRVKTEISGNTVPVPKALKIGAYRLVQEALNNSYKHADGIGQCVALRSAGRLIKITVCDEGPGFVRPTDDDDETAHLGMTGIRDRIETLGGSLEVSSAPGQGTRLEAMFDLDSLNQAGFENA